MEVTIEITSYCDYNCDYCSTNASKKGKHLGFEKIEEFLKSSWKNVFDAAPRFLDESVGWRDNEYAVIERINISGGEPLSHPRFYDILKLCRSYTDNVWVYTNALTQIIYNSDIVQEIKVEANVCLIPGRNIYIPKDVSKVHLLQLVKQGRAKNMEPGKYHVSSNIEKVEDCDHNCNNCQHILLQADEKIVAAPCKKNYDGR
jgi:hypothetical protein